MSVMISGSGVYHPKDQVTNQALVDSYNAYVENYNRLHRQDILDGKCQPLAESSADFIQKASGIESRYVIDKGGILNPDIMQPVLESRADESLSYQAEMGVNAAKSALNNADKIPEQIDAIIVACSNFERPYPAISIEIQKALGAGGFAFDMNVACSSATFAIVNAKALISSGTAKTVLVISPEICSAHLNFRCRDSHFIFGDVATAVVIESEEALQSNDAFEIVSSELWTEFSNNIRNNAGFLTRLSPDTAFSSDKLFYQNGRKVFKEVSAEVCRLVHHQLEKNDLTIEDITCFWMHQANSNMNRVILQKLLGSEPDESRAPIILNEYANTASCGSIIAFHQYRENLSEGDLGLLCSFGAGYSIGSLVLRKNR